MDNLPINQLELQNKLQLYRIDSLYFISKFSQAYRIISCDTMDVEFILN